MTIKFFDDDVKKKLEADKAKFLHAAGLIGQNEWRSTSPYITGVYKNSVHYKIGSFESAYGTEGEGQGTGKLGTPKKDTVRIGLNLVYANSIERQQGVGVRAMDNAIKSIDNDLSKHF